MQGDEGSNLDNRGQSPAHCRLCYPPARILLQFDRRQKKLGHGTAFKAPIWPVSIGSGFARCLGGK